MSRLEPFLRWAGGKRWLASGLGPWIKDCLGGKGRYFEPFMGSGAMFFAVKPIRAFLSDLNEDLVNAFRAVERDTEAVVEALSALPSSRETYYRMRASTSASPFDRAVRFIYLNRNCYGGLYRENRQGNFNVPYGGGDRNHMQLCARGTIHAAASVLKRPEIVVEHCDFEAAFSQVCQGDVVYCDPTYREVTRSKFDRYGKLVFSWEDQQRLATLAAAAAGRGALVVVSNTGCADVRGLYSRARHVQVQRRKGLGPSRCAGLRHEYLYILGPARRPLPPDALPFAQVSHESDAPPNSPETRGRYAPENTWSCHRQKT